MAGILIWVFVDTEDELLVPLMLILPTFACSLICLLVKHKAGYWCVWSTAAPIVLISPQMVGLPILSAANVSLVVLAVIMAFVAVKVFDEDAVSADRKNKLRLILGWILTVFLRSLSYVLIFSATIITAIAWLPYMITELIIYVGTALLVTYTACYVKNIKRNNK
jgi:hypothetical protein